VDSQINIYDFTESVQNFLAPPHTICGWLLNMHSFFEVNIIGTNNKQITVTVGGF
jgi:hypothetical protein